MLSSSFDLQEEFLLFYGNRARKRRRQSVTEQLEKFERALEATGKQQANHDITDILIVEGEFNKSAFTHLRFVLHALERVDADFRSALLDEHPVIKTIYEEGAVLRGENVGSAASERVTLSLEFLRVSFLFPIWRDARVPAHFRLDALRTVARYVRIRLSRNPSMLMFDDNQLIGRYVRDELDFAISNFDHEQNRLPNEGLADALFIQHLARLDSARLWEETGLSLRDELSRWYRALAHVDSDSYLKPSSRLYLKFLILKGIGTAYAHVGDVHQFRHCKASMKSLIQSDDDENLPNLEMMKAYLHRVVWFPEEEERFVLPRPQQTDKDVPREHLLPSFIRTYRLPVMQAKKQDKPEQLGSISGQIDKHERSVWVFKRHMDRSGMFKQEWGEYYRNLEQLNKHMVGADFSSGVEREYYHLLTGSSLHKTKGRPRELYMRGNKPGPKELSVIIGQFVATAETATENLMLRCPGMRAVPYLKLTCFHSTTHLARLLLTCGKKDNSKNQTQEGAHKVSFADFAEHIEKQRVTLETVADYLQPLIGQQYVDDLRWLMNKLDCLSKQDAGTRRIDRQLIHVGIEIHNAVFDVHHPNGAFSKSRPPSRLYFIQPVLGFGKED